MKNRASCFELPWNAWYEDSTITISCPDTWQVDVFHLNDWEPIPTKRFREEALSLGVILERKRISSVAIAIDDLTRPMGYEEFFDTLFKQLNLWSHPPEVKIIIGLGTHRPLERMEVQMKVGRGVFQYSHFVKVINHDYKNDVIPVDIEWGKIPVKINRHFVEAQFRVILSAIVPHPFAGFSGGPKMVFPGLSNIEVTKRTHQMALMGFVGKIGNVKNNKFRKIIDEFIKKIPVDHFIGFLTGEHRECLYMKSGDLIKTFYSLTEIASQLYYSPIPNKKYDVVWLNAYPKDTELLQIDTAFNPILSAKNKFWHDNTIFVISAACSKGLGGHGLFGPGGLLYRPPREKRMLKGHTLLFLLPNIAAETFSQVVWERYQFFSCSHEIIAQIQKKLGKSKTKVAVFPVASIQMVSNA